MVRIGLSVYLMLATLAGPSLCCCTTTRLVASLTHAREAGQPKPSCFQHHHQDGAGDYHTSRKKSPQNQERPGQPACPCQETRFEPVALLSPDAESAKQVPSRFLCCSLSDVFGTLPVTALLSVASTPPIPRERLALPFVTSHDLLHALHLLRC
jgi:hypothetical protein